MLFENNDIAFLQDFSDFQDSFWELDFLIAGNPMGSED